MLNEMLSHLERQPRNKERCITWLKSADSLFNGVGIMLLAHFRRIFPLLFQWMHADNNEIIILVSTFKYVLKLWMTLFKVYLTEPKSLVVTCNVEIVLHSK